MFNNNDINDPFNFGDDTFSNLPPFIDDQEQNNDGYMSHMIPNIDP